MRQGPARVVRRVAVVIQARLGSTRLPGKTMADIAGRPMLAHAVDRARRIRGVDAVVLATTDRLEDDRLAEFATAEGLPYVRGSETDVLDRFHLAIETHPADVIVRVTPDCPLLDPEVSARVVGEFLRHAGDVDYVSNVAPPTYPDGLDTEVFSRAALDRAWREATLPSDREHVTTYMRGRPDRFHAVNVSGTDDLSSLRWTVDTAADLAFVRTIYRLLVPTHGLSFGMDDVLGIVRAHPDVALVNAGIRRNEGLERSRAADPGMLATERPEPSR